MQKFLLIGFLVLAFPQGFKFELIKSTDKLRAFFCLQQYYFSNNIILLDFA